LWSDGVQLLLQKPTWGCHMQHAFRALPCPSMLQLLLLLQVELMDCHKMTTCGVAC
jgi:hypothetical protein